MYDELVVHPVENRWCLRYNLEGSIHAFVPMSRDGHRRWDPLEYLHSEPKRFVHEVESALGLSAPSSMPLTTPRTLTYRVLAELMARNFLKVGEVKLLNGFLDVPDEDAGPREDLFADFASLPPRIRADRPDDFFGQGGYRFWFLMVNERPELMFEISGASVWRRGAFESFEPFDLMSAYAAAGRDLNAMMARFDAWRMKI
ncbi:hypothetical protein GCM10027418_07170 [Mariniluteicoccus endophyticus]